MKLSGHMIVKNGVKFDYPFVEAALSAIPMCDEFIIVEGNGDDGTYEKLLELQANEPKVKLFRKDWDVNHYTVLANLTNFAIEQTSGDYHFQIQADEVIHEKYHPLILSKLRENFDWCTFGVLHFFGGFNKVYKPGVFYDSYVRLAKRDCYPNICSYGDAMSLGTPKCSPNHFKIASFHKAIKVYHYGYVRKPKTLIEKQIDFTKLYGILELDQYLQNGLDRKKIDWNEKHDPDRLADFTDAHPAVMLKWIEERREMVENGIVE